MKSMRIKMVYSDGTVYFWTVRRDPRTSWEFTDHDGYTRVVGGNWLNFVPRFRLVAENYGMTTDIS